MSNEFNNAEKIQEIAKFAAKASGFDLDSIDGETIQLSTRANGDVGSETPGKEDIRTAFAAAREIHERFPQANCSIDTVDEWTNLAVEIHDRPLPTSPIGGGTLQKNLREAALELAKDALLGLVPSGPCIYVPSTGIGVTLMPFGSKEWRKIIRLDLDTHGHRTAPGGYTYQLSVYASGQGTKTFAAEDPSPEGIAALIRKISPTLAEIRETMEKLPG